MILPRARLRRRLRVGRTRGERYIKTTIFQDEDVNEMRSRRFRIFEMALALCVTTGAGSAFAAQTEGGVTETRLPNGLRVLTKEVHSAPVVCTYVWYRVGSRNETPPVTGVSHQLEHMLFKGTKKLLKPGDIDILIGRHGGENNASTDTDATCYYFLLPADQLDIALRIEADRMTNAAIDPKQLDAEKTVVLSELEGDENDNSYFLYENVRAAAYRYHPYHYPVIGTKWDVKHFTRTAVYDYYRKFYAPNNATLVLVGDFDTTKVLARVRELWKDVQPSHVPNPPLDPEPEQRGERRVVVRRAGNTAYLEGMWHIPAATHADLPALTVLATALTSGRSSLLYKALVETQLAASVSASANQGVAPEVFDISASVRSGVEASQVEKALRAELARVQSEKLDDRALQKAKNQTRASFLFAQDSVLAQASRLGFYQTVTGDWRNLLRYLSKINAVTASDVQRVAKTYLKDDNLTFGTFLPTSENANAENQAEGDKQAAHYKPVGKHHNARVKSNTTPRPVLVASLGTSTKTSFLSLTGRGTGGERRHRKVVPSGVEKKIGQISVPVVRKLSNGLTVIVRENHANPTVAVGGFVRAGSVNDPAGKQGLANITAEMLTRGTATRTSQQIAEATDFVGASIGADASRERTDLSGAMLTENFETILGLFAECLRTPSFPAEELEKVRGEILTELQEEDEDTATVAMRGLYTTLYPADSTYAHAPIGTAADVKGVTRDDVVAFYGRAYRPERTTLIIVGDVSASAAFEAVEKAFGDWKGEGEALPEYRPEPIKPAATAPPPKTITIPDKSQNDIAMGSLALARTSSDYEAAHLMNLVLGEDTFVGRVGKRVRDTEGLAYYANTYFVLGLEVGPFLFRAGVNPTNVPRAIASAKSEIARMAAQGVTESELAWAKDHAIGASRLALATNRGIASEIENEVFYGLGLDYTERYPRLIHGLTKADADAAAKKYLHPSAFATVIAGPPVPGLEKGKTPAGSEKP